MTRTPKPTFGRWALAVCAVPLAALSFAPAASAATKKKDKDPTIKAMTRNLYLGGNIFLPIGAPDRATFEAKTQELWNQVQFTNFPARAKALAREIDSQDPDVVGLQEVALWRRSPTGVKDGGATPSTQVVYDFRKSLEKELKARKLKYRVVSIQNVTDIEAPTQQYDVRMTLRNAILVRTGKGAPKVKSKKARQYTTRIGVPVQTGTVTSVRGYQYIDGSLDGRKFRFVNTHLESIAEPTRAAQAKELAAKSGPLFTSRPLILTGDLNSGPIAGNDATPAAYNTLIGAGLKDGWIKAGGSQRAFTFGVRDPKLQGAFTGDRRIDHVLYKGKKLKALKGAQVGKNPKLKAAGGLWPSDHAGEAVSFRLSK